MAIRRSTAGWNVPLEAVARIDAACPIACWRPRLHSCIKDGENYAIALVDFLP